MCIHKYLTILFLLITINAFTRNYYVSASGNDLNDGLSEKTAWKTIAKVNAEMKNFKSGDLILFNAGNEFYGSLIIPNKTGITISSFGNGKAIITGGRPITGWTYLGNNIWSSKSNDPIYQVTSNNEVFMCARFPEYQGKFASADNYVTITSKIDDSNFICDALKSKNGFTGSIKGSMAHIMGQHWSLEGRTVTSFNNATGQVTISPGYKDLSKGDLLFINSAYDLLTKQDDWYYDELKHQLYIYSSHEPKDIYGTILDDSGIKIEQSNNIEISNLTVKNFYKGGIFFNNCKNLKIYENNVINNYEFGIKENQWGSANGVVISNNLITGSNIRGISLFSEGAVARDNTMVELSLFNNIAKKSIDQSVAIEFFGQGTQIIGNTIEDVGYIGIRLNGQNSLVKNNFIKNTCLLQHDGAAIYTWNSNFSKPGASGSVINGNIVEGAGLKKKTSWWANGIYLDDKTHNLTISNNAVSKTYIGIFLHNTKHHLVANNNIFKTISHGILLKEDHLGIKGEMTGNKLENNKILLLNETYLPLSVQSEWDTYNFAEYKKNYYFGMYQYANIDFKRNSEEKRYNLEDWQIFSKKDTNSKENNILFDPYTTVINGPNLISNSDFEKNISGWKSIINSGNLSMETDGKNHYIKSKTADNEIITSPSFSIIAGKSYILEFDCKSELNGNGIVALFRPDGWITYDSFVIDYKQGWNHYKIKLDSDYSTNSAKVRFEINDHTGSVNLDNVTINEASFKEIPEQAVFPYNHESNLKSIGLPKGNWEDLEGKIFSGSVELEPFNSLVLMRSEKTTTSIKVNAGEDVVICRGDSTRLSASEGGISYTWSTGETTQSITVKPDKITTYTVTVSDGTNSASDYVVVNVNETIANAGADRAINAGETTTLTATGGDTYIWSTGETTELISVSPSATTSYSVKVTKNGCQASDEVKITVNPTPEPGTIAANVGADVTLCFGENTILTASGGTSYVWSTGETTQSITVKPDKTTTYTVTVSDGTNSASDDVVVTVNETIANAGADVTIDSGQAINLNATGGDTYLWSTGETSSMITVNPLTTTNYTVKVIKNGCEATDTVQVNVREFLPALADAGNDVTICKGESVTLKGQGGYSFNWNTGEVTQNITVNPYRTTTYTLTAARAGSVSTDQVTVTVINCDLNNGVNNSVSITTDNISTSNPAELDDAEVLNKADFELTVYPIPSQGRLKIQTTSPIYNFNLVLININGNVIFTDTMDAEVDGLQKELDLSKFAKGVYLMQLYNADENYLKKIILI